MFTPEDFIENIKNKNASKVSEYFKFYLNNSEEEARSLIDSVLGILSKSTSKRSFSDSNQSTGPSQKVARTESSDVLPKFFNDSVDDESITIAALIPHDPTLLAFVIGKGGAAVAEIQQKSGTKLQIEKYFSTNNLRYIFIQGQLKKAIIAYHLLCKRIEERGGEYANINLSRFVVPHDLVAHVIGKAGVTIKRLQSENNCVIEFQHESEMMSSNGPFYGRTATVSGQYTPRLNAIYAVCRFLLQDRDFPEAWRGKIPVALGSIAPPGGNMGPPRMSLKPPGMSPKPPGMSPNPPGMSLKPPVPPSGSSFHPDMAPQGMGGLGRLEIMIPTQSIAFVIGAKGVNIIEIERASGCKVTVEKTSSGNSPDRKVVIDGPSQSIGYAADLLSGRVQEWRSLLDTAQRPSRTPNSTTSAGGPSQDYSQNYSQAGGLGYSQYPQQGSMPQQAQYAPSPYGPGGTPQQGYPQQQPAAQAYPPQQQSTYAPPQNYRY